MFPQRSTSIVMRSQEFSGEVAALNKDGRTDDEIDAGRKLAAA
jgi:hypothetical protein